jgi:hypothetical protein
MGCPRRKVYLSSMAEVIMNRSGIQHTIFFFLFFLIVVTAGAQCNPESYSMNCIEGLMEEYIYLRSYNIDGHSGTIEEIENSVVFSKNTKYLLNICTSSHDADGIVLSIYDSQRKQVATNLLKNRIHSEMEFDCTLTGIYYLTFTFQDSENYCGGCILSFRKQ